MIQINNAKLFKGYDYWENEYEKESNIQIPERAGIKTLGIRMERGKRKEVFGC